MTLLIGWPHSQSHKHKQRVGWNSRTETPEMGLPWEREFCFDIRAPRHPSTGSLCNPAKYYKPEDLPVQQPLIFLGQQGKLQVPPHSASLELGLSQTVPRQKLQGKSTRNTFAINSHVYLFLTKSPIKVTGWAWTTRNCISVTFLLCY